MANYPDYPILLGSSQKPEKGWRDTSSSSGAPHSKQTQGKAYSEFSLLHQLTGTEYEALLAVEAADPDITHTLTYRNESPAITYTVKFTGPPQITRNIGGNKYEVRASLRGFTD